MRFNDLASDSIPWERMGNLRHPVSSLQPAGRALSKPSDQFQSIHTPVSPWPGTGSLKACTSPSPSNGSTTVPIKATARFWTCTSAGRTPSSAGTTRPPDGTSPGSETSGTEPTVSTRPAKRPKPSPQRSEKPAKRPKPGLKGPKPGQGNSKLNSGGARNPDRSDTKYVSRPLNATIGAFGGPARHYST